MVHKAGAFVIRRTAASGRPAELLLFAHADFPQVPLQIPGGSIEPGEAPDAAALRELHEEAGIVPLPLIREIGVSETPSHLEADAIVKRHCFLFDGGGLPDRWIHSVTGAGDDKGLRFEYRWHTVGSELRLAGSQGYFLNPGAIPELYA